jgi:hypothetical protein
MAMDRDDLEAITAAINKGFQARGTTAAGSSGGEKTVSKDTFDSIFTKFGKGLFKGAEQIVTRGGGRLADVSDQFSSTLGGLIGYVENTNDVFQSLSKVGAGFDADLGAIRQSAAATRLPLDAFAGLIAKNTAELAGFSGGVNAGAKRFTQLSQSMFDSNLIENFMDLGLTVEESNEFLMRNMAMDRRRARLQGLTNQQQVQSALELAKSMDVMAKLTGKSVQEQQDSMTARMREGATQARLRLLESQGVTGASEAYKNAQSALEGSPKVVGDLLADLTQTGVPMTEATKNFAATNKEAYALLQQSAAATKRGDAVQAQKLAQQAAAATAKFAGSQQGLTLATLAQVSDIAKGQADRLEEVGPIIDSIAEHSDKLAKELGRTPTIFETYNDMLSKAVDIQGKQLGGTLPGQGAQQSVREGQLGLANIATTFNKELGKALSGSEVANGIFEGLTKFITESGDKISKVAGGAVNLAGGTTLDDVSSASNNPNVKRDANTLSDPTATADEKSSAQQRLIDANILNADGSLNVNVVNETFNQSFERLQEQLKNAEPRERDTILGKINKLIGGGRAIGGGVQQGMAYKVGELGPETFLAGMDGAIIPNMKAMLNRMPDIAGQLQAEMQAMGAPMSQAAKSAAVEMQSSTSVEQKLDILNQTMMQLVNINTTQARTGEKALRQNRSVGNLMGGLGRA